MLNNFCKYFMFKFALIILMLIALLPTTAEAKKIFCDMKIPYSIGQNITALTPGNLFQGRLHIFYTEALAAQGNIVLNLPKGITAQHLPPNWQREISVTGGERISFTHNFAAGYDNWFELLQFKTDEALISGTYEIEVIVDVGAEHFSEVLPVEVETSGATITQAATITNMILPYSRENGQDIKLDNGTIILRNSLLDYYKNIINGKGALNVAAEAAHPLSHLGLVWHNPAQQTKILFIQLRLIDPATGEVIPGLISPESSINDEGHDGGLGSTRTHLTVMAALDGTERQIMDLPIYADELVLESGSYTLEIVAVENDDVIATANLPVRIIAKDIYSGAVTLLALLVALVGLPYILASARLRNVKSRHLITAGLFGTTAFAIVNVPTTFLNDFMQILLGPFSFMISGMFSGVLLYMLLASLVIIIPKVGIVTLMLIVRMLINMLVFGHISPLMILVYGVPAILLEAGLWLSGITRGNHRSDKSIVFGIALSCSIADMVSTYVNLAAFSFLYRLFYADWYIILCVLVSGCLYPAIGAACGVYLGKELKKVGVD